MSTWDVIDAPVFEVLEMDFEEERVTVEVGIHTLISLIHDARLMEYEVSGIAPRLLIDEEKRLERLACVLDTLADDPFLET